MECSPIKGPIDEQLSATPAEVSHDGCWIATRARVESASRRCPIKQLDDWSFSRELTGPHLAAKDRRCCAASYAAEVTAIIDWDGVRPAA